MGERGEVGVPVIRGAWNKTIPKHAPSARCTCGILPPRAADKKTDTKARDLGLILWLSSACVTSSFSQSIGFALTQTSFMFDQS